MDKKKKLVVSQPDDGTRIYVFDVVERTKRMVVVQAKSKQEAKEMAHKAFKGEDVVIKEAEGTFSF